MCYLRINCGDLMKNKAFLATFSFAAHSVFFLSSAYGQTNAPSAHYNSSALRSKSLSEPYVLLAQNNFKSDYASAVKAFRGNSFPEAISLFGRVVDNQSANQEFIDKALIGRSQSFLVIGQPLLAILDLKKVKYNPSQTVQIGAKELIFGVAYIQSKQYQLAIKHLSLAVNLLPDDESVYTNRAVAYQSLNDYDSAAKDIERALQINPTPATVFNLAVLEKDRRNYRRCYQLLSEIERQEAAFVDVYLQRGICAKNLGKNEQALSDFIKAASIDDQRPEVIENIGLIMVVLGDKTNGLKYLEAASTLYLTQGNINGFEKVSNAISSANSN